MPLAVEVQLLILWTGIAAFVLIGLFPPMTQWKWPYLYQGHSTAQDINIPIESHVDLGCLMGRLAVVIGLTGGLLWSEAQVGPRFYPWLRAKVRRRITLGMVTVAVLVLVTTVVMERADILRDLLGVP